jgi:hypothetical protein
MDRAEHLAWAKTRALTYVDRGDLTNAMASFVSDMRKHPDTADVIDVMGMIGMTAAISGNPNEMRRFIEGFN